MSPCFSIRLLELIALAVYLGIALAGYCDSPSPAFPIPSLSHCASAKSFSRTSQKVNGELQRLLSNPAYDNTSLSLSVTSQTDTLFSYHHTARVRSSLHHGGAKSISNDTNYRIASMTKPFTVLALLQLQKAEKLDLDDSILVYLPELNNTSHGNGSLPWKDITVRSLASQFAGIPRDFAQSDLLSSPDEAAAFGLPPLDHDKVKHDEALDLPTCDGMSDYSKTCNSTDLLAWVRQLRPVFAPHQQSSYSNINFDLLGLVIAKVSGISFEDYITTKILEPIGMRGGSGFVTPPDEKAAIPAGTEFYWDFQVGVQNPTGGMYSNTADQDVWLRYVLSTFNAQGRGVNWFMPRSWGSSLQGFYGLPWEIYRVKTEDMVGTKGISKRPITLITKGGGLPGYTSDVFMVPEYGLGITILVAGESKLLGEVRQLVVGELVGFAERCALHELQTRYVGRYIEDAPGAKPSSEVILRASARDGLYVEKWISNGTDTKSFLEKHMGRMHGEEVIFNVVPTLLFVDEEKQAGERWRVVPQKRRTKKNSKKTNVWDEFCLGDVDIAMYAGKPLNELVFYGGEAGGEAEYIELTGFRKILGRKGKRGSAASWGLGGLREQMRPGW